MTQADDWHSGWADQERRIGATSRRLTVAGVLLASFAVAESIARSALTGVSAQLALVLCLLALSSTLPLALMISVPAAMAVSATSIVSLALFHVLTVAGLLAELIALYGLAQEGSQRNGSQVVAVGLAVPFLVLALAGFLHTGSEAAVLAMLLASLGPAAAWAGIARRARGEAQMHSAARQVVADSLIEHTARGERARIARELHDVVAHHISMVVVQAETARLTTPGMPVAGAQRLTAIGGTARAALTEMRRLLGVLREDAQPDAPDRRPQPGLGQLNELLDEARDASGSGTRLILQGAPIALDPGVELAAYRIAQEALTNVRRHAPGAAVDVELHYTGDALRLRIRDNGPGLPPVPLAGGHGLTGMRERAAAVGGELRTGPAPGGGFLLEATLPADAEALP